MISHTLATLYQRYIQAFAQLDIEAVKQCYLMPCTLSTPDKVVLLDSDDKFNQEFTQIFKLISAENITAFKTSNASYDVITPSVIVAAIDWQFLTNANNVFTEFTAIYHLTKQGDDIKIINVISQDVSQSITLRHPLNIQWEK